MKTFHLERMEDVSNFSGTGKVAQGVVFDNGWCAMTWLTALSSVAFYPDAEILIAIHGHEGKTKLVWD